MSFIMELDVSLFPWTNWKKVFPISWGLKMFLSVYISESLINKISIMS